MGARAEARGEMVTSAEGVMGFCGSGAGRRCGVDRGCIGGEGGCMSPTALDTSDARDGGAISRVAISKPCARFRSSANVLILSIGAPCEPLGGMCPKYRMRLRSREVFSFTVK